MKITYIPVDELTPYTGNARIHGRESVEAIKKSIQEFGFEDPIAVWGEQNIIIEGHGRYKAARELGISEVPCIRLDHLTDEERRAYTIASNSTAELSGWDFDVLEDELKELSRFDMTAYGFDEEQDYDGLDIDKLLQQEPEEKEPTRVFCPVCGKWFEV